MRSLTEHVRNFIFAKKEMDMDGMMHPYLFYNNTPFYMLFRWALIRTESELKIAAAISFTLALFTTVLSLSTKYFSSSNENLLKPKTSSLTLFTQIFCQYITMLIVMIMNVWLIFAVVVGHSVGYLICGIRFKLLENYEKKSKEANYGSCGTLD